MVHFDVPFNKLNHVHWGELRPRFRLKTDLSPGDITSLIDNHLKQDRTVLGTITEEYAILSIPSQDLHYWSPELQVRVSLGEYQHEGSTVIRCLVGPRQTVWSLFMFFYAFIGLASLFGGLYGFAQLQVGNSSIFTWFLPIGALLLPTIWLAAKYGQRTGRDQMLHLISFLYHAIDEHGHVERIE